MVSLLEMSPHLPRVSTLRPEDQLAASLKALSALLYVLGISHQGVADLLESLLHPDCKTTVYNNVQAARKRVRRLPTCGSCGNVHGFGFPRVITLAHVRLPLGQPNDSAEADLCILSNTLINHDW